MWCVAWCRCPECATASRPVCCIVFRTAGCGREQPAPMMQWQEEQHGSTRASVHENRSVARGAKLACGAHQNARDAARRYGMAGAPLWRRTVAGDAPVGRSMNQASGGSAQWRREFMKPVRLSPSHR